MNEIVLYGIIALILELLELLYFKVADLYNIIDKPNERSSHTLIVLRGGGVIFVFGVWIYAIVSGFHYPWFLFGLTLISLVSFIDDVHSLPDRYRLIIHFVSMLMIIYQFGILQLDNWWIILLILILLTGVINAYNFMDGINGITGGYSLAILISLLIENHNNHFVDNQLLIIVSLSVCVFCLFNYRNKAKCFAGDVGSVSIAFVLLFATGLLVIKDGGAFYYLTFFVLYGVDTMLTICHRIMLHENLGEAHRKHAYQIMANELHISHVKVSTMYSVIQLLVSLGLIYSGIDPWAYFASTCIIFGIIYLLFMKKYYHLHEEYLSSICESKSMRSLK